MGWTKAKTMKERHVKPHFTFSGGIWYCFRQFDNDGGYPDHFPVKHAHLFFDAERMDKMLGSYAWWKRKDPKNARLTDAMLIRYASVYRFWDTVGRKRFEYVGSSTLFAMHRGSKHARDYTAYLQRRIKPKAGRRTVITADMVQAMIASGYCRTSNNYKRVSRIDREDWREVLALDYSSNDPTGDGMARALGDRSGDYYRRGFSKDSLTIDDDYLFKQFPGSSDGPDYYLPLCEDV